jgi:hypothetical protein
MKLNGVPGRHMMEGGGTKHDASGGRVKGNGLEERGVYTLRSF